MHRPMVLFAVALTAAACSPSSRGASGPLSDPSARIDDTLAIAVGREAFTRDRGLAVTYVRQVSESRCPANVVCVWQGDAAIRLKAASRGGIVEATIHTALDPKVIEVGGYRVSVVDVRPHPGTSDSSSTPAIVVRVVRDQ